MHVYATASAARSFLPSGWRMPRGANGISSMIPTNEQAFPGRLCPSPPSLHPHLPSSTRCGQHSPCSSHITIPAPLPYPCPFIKIRQSPKGWRPTPPMLTTIPVHVYGTVYPLLRTPTLSRQHTASTPHPSSTFRQACSSFSLLPRTSSMPWRAARMWTRNRKHCKRRLGSHPVEQASQASRIRLPCLTVTSQAPRVSTKW